MVVSGVISRVTIVSTQIWGLVSPLITTHEPASSVRGVEPRGRNQRRCWSERAAISSEHQKSRRFGST